MSFLGRLAKALPFLVVIGLVVWLWTVADGFVAPSRPGRLGPDAWPKIVLALMLVAAIWGLVQTLLAPGRGEGTSILIRQASRAVGREEEAEKDLEAEAGGGGESRPFLAIGGMAALLGYVAAIPYLGFTITTFLLMLTIMLLGGYTRPLRATLIAGIGALAFFFMFQRIVYVSLPMGEGPFKAFTAMLMASMGVR